MLFASHSFVLLCPGLTKPEERRAQNSKAQGLHHSIANVSSFSAAWAQRMLKIYPYIWK